MTDDLASQLQNLQNVRELPGEDTYQQSLDKLRQRYGAEKVNALLQQTQQGSPITTGDENTITQAGRACLVSCLLCCVARG
jgi:hypothetical protein